MKHFNKYIEDWHERLEIQNKVNPPHWIWKWITTALLMALFYIVVWVK